MRRLICILSFLLITPMLNPSGWCEGTSVKTLNDFALEGKR